MSVTRWIQLKITYFVTTYQLSKKSLQKHQHTYYKFILEKFTAFPSDHSFNVCLMHHLFLLRNWKQNIFSTPRWKSWNGRFPIASLYEFTSSQKFSVLVSQASCLIMARLNSSPPWDEIFYGRDCGQRHKYSLFSVAWMNSGIGMKLS